MLANLPVARSAGARTLFLASAIITAVILVWIHRLLLSGEHRGLSDIFFFLFTAFDYPAAICALVILLVALFVPGGLPFRPLLRWVGEHPLSIAAACVVLLSIGTLTIYHDHRLSMDEYTQFMQSQVFAAGHLTGLIPSNLIDWLIPWNFQDYFIAVSRPTGRIASDYWPSFALLLTPFTWLGIPWACNAVISALTLVVLHRFALRLFGDAESAGLVLLLTVASPAFFANGISYYSMPADLFANCLYALLLLEPTRGRAFAAGIVGSVALTLHNPVPHMLFALPWLIWVARREDGFRLFASLCAGYLPLCVVLGIGWFWLDEHLAHAGGGAAAGTNFARVAQFFKTPDAATLLARLIGVAKVWVWAVPGLLVLACAGAWRWRRHPICRLLVASALLTLVGYVFVPVDQGHGWGYRYFHSAWIALPLLAAAALKRMPSVESSSGLESEDVRAFIVACAVLTLTVGIGLRAHQIDEFIARDLRQVPAYSGTERRVVFVDTVTDFYGEDLVQNDPWLRKNEVRMLSRGARFDAAFMRKYFPDFHHVYGDVHGTVWSAAPPRLAGGPR